MLSREQADVQAESLLREARAAWPRNKPAINLIPLYYRMCPELRRFDQPDALAIVQMANRAVMSRPQLNMLLRVWGGILMGAAVLRFPLLAWAIPPLGLGSICFGFWRVRQKIAEICARQLPETRT